MSIRLMSMVWEVQFPTQSQLLAALKLADFANDDGGSIYPSRNRLAYHCQCSETTAKVVLRCFRECGLLIVVKEGGNGPRDTTEYCFDLDLLRALADGRCTITGGGEELEIVWSEAGDSSVDNPQNKGAEKGAEPAPLEAEGGGSAGLRGRNGPEKGAASRPQPISNKTTNIEPSFRASASAKGGALAPALPALVIREGDTSWLTWLDHIATHAGEAARERALRAGTLTVAARWPREGVPLPNIPGHKPEGLSDRSRQMAGEAQ